MLHPSYTITGDTILPREAFIREVEDFHDRLMAATAERVEAALNGALSPEQIKVALRPPEPRTDWDAARAAIRKIEAMPI